MIGFAMPWIFGVALAAALTITALHFLSVRQPRVLLLPTARFVPERDARAVARQAKPNDPWLLLLRVIALLATGAALAGARCGAQGARTSSIVVIDEAQRVDSAALRSRVVRAVPTGDVVDAGPPTVLWVRGVSDDPGVAIAAAIREAARQAQANPALVTLSLTVVMPETVRSRREWDAWRTQWPAGIRVVHPREVGTADRIATIPPELSTVRVQHSNGARGADVVEAAFALRGVRTPPDPVANGADVVVYRSKASAPTSARVTVLWPENGVPTGWRAASATDSVGAVIAAGVVLVAPWVRTALPPPLSDSVRAIAWWSDGVAAAVERTRGTTCVREVAIAVAEGSDLLLSPAAEGLLRALRAPCGGVGVPAPREPARATGPAAGMDASRGNAPASRFRALGEATYTSRPTWLALALLTLALFALVAESVVRRESAGAAAT